jgi:2-dehydro-3-deoxy-D-arabinonate dehydratase
MRLIQFWSPGVSSAPTSPVAPNAPGSGSVRFGMVDDKGTITDITPADGSIRTTNDMITLAVREQTTLGDIALRLRDNLDQSGGRITSFKYNDLDIAPAIDRPHLLMPILAPEVWACDTVYAASVEQRRAYDNALGDLYERAFKAPRGALFFKGTATRCVGPNTSIRIRRDSNLTIAEPEIALVLDAAGHILAYTLANDVTALDLEQDNPLYLSLAKIYQGSCALGPTLYTAEPLGRQEKDVAIDPFELFCRILDPDGSTVIYQAQSSTASMARSFDDLIAALLADNPIPNATVLLTGAGALPAANQGLQVGQIVEISNEQIGTLRNPVERAAVIGSRISTAEIATPVVNPNPQPASEQ